MSFEVRVQEADFDVGELSRSLLANSDHIGAMVHFIGTMRSTNEGSDVRAMTLEHYPGMTERCIEEILEQARQRFGLIAATVVHRVGEILPQQQIVFVGVCTSHRHSAFQACDFIMDYLKSQATFWKKEQLADGSRRWVDARHSDAEALERWYTP